MEEHIQSSLSKIIEHKDSISYGYYMSLTKVLEQIAEDLDTLTAMRRYAVIYDPNDPAKDVQHHVPKPLNILEDDLEISE